MLIPHTCLLRSIQLRLTYGFSDLLDGSLLGSESTKGIGGGSEKSDGGGEKLHFCWF